MRFKVGCDNRVSLWIGPWSNQVPFSERFQNFTQISRLPNYFHTKFFCFLNNQRYPRSPNFRRIPWSTRLSCHVMPCHATPHCTYMVESEETGNRTHDPQGANPAPLINLSNSSTAIQSFLIYDAFTKEIWR